MERLESRHLLAVWAEFVGDFTQTPDPTPTFPDSFYAHDGVVYFSATDDAYGRELWQFDGQEVSRLTDIHFGPYDSEPDEIIALGDEIFFHAAIDQDGSDLDRGLWKLREEGLSLVNERGLTPREHSPSATRPRDPRYPVVFRSQVYFGAEPYHNQYGGIWQTDGQSAEMVVGLSRASFLTVYQNALYFADDEVLPRYDGQDNVDEISADSGYSKPRSLTVFGNDLYFTADSGQYGRELWRLSRSVLDGVETLDVELVVDIVPGSDDSNPEYLTVYGGDLYFAASDELYRLDGQTAQSVALNLNPSALTVFDNTLYFRGQTADRGRELWSFDGQTVARITDLNESGDSLAAPTPFVEFVDYDSSDLVRGNFAATEDAPYFAGRTSDSEPYGLWRYDGTSVEAVDMSQSSNQGDRISSMYSVSEDLVFTYQYTPTGNPQAFAVSGQRMQPIPGVMWISDSFKLNDIAYVTARQASQTTFAVYESQTVTPVPSTYEIESSPAVVFGGELFFRLPTTTSGRELGKFDGTVYFLADDGVHGRELWRVVESEYGNPDLDGDSTVSLLDLMRLNGRLGRTGSDGADLDQDGIVSRRDVALMLRDFGERPSEIPAFGNLPPSSSTASAPVRRRRSCFRRRG